LKRLSSSVRGWGADPLAEREDYSEVEEPISPIRGAHDVHTLFEIHEALKPHYSMIVLILSWIGFLYVWWRRRSAWRNKEFLGRVNFSLNFFGDTLYFRTLLEMETTAFLPNSHGVGILQAAAQRTTAEQPFIEIANSADRDYMYRAVVNALSVVCPQAFVAKALGAPVRCGTFRFALTCERYPEIRTIKLRVLLIEEGALREYVGPGGKAEQLPITGNSRTRLQTLQAMHEMDRKAASGAAIELGRVELAVPDALPST